MTGYAIKGGCWNAYVARPGSRSSYTRNLEHARIFATKEQAEREACENERVICLDRLLSHQ